MQAARLSKSLADGILCCQLKTALPMFVALPSHQPANPLGTPKV